MTIQEAFEAITHPDHVWTWDELRQNRGLPPAEAGIYSWWFRNVPADVPVAGTLCHQGLRLLYVGISPRRPSARRESPSSQNIRKRIRYHYRGNAKGSTLRLTLGCLLGEALGIRLQVVGHDGRMTFGGGELDLTEWMSQNALVAWAACPHPWLVESEAIRRLRLPLNLDQNDGDAFSTELSARRSAAKLSARHEWTLTNGGPIRGR
jgi:hypothetical protein